MTTRFCIGCCLPKDRAEFDPSETSADGLCYFCRACVERLKSQPRNPRRKVIPPGHKECHNCRGVFAFDQFQQSKQSRDGLSALCIKCRPPKPVKPPKPAKVVAPKPALVSRHPRVDAMLADMWDHGAPVSAAIMRRFNLSPDCEYRQVWRRFGLVIIARADGAFVGWRSIRAARAERAA